MANEDKNSKAVVMKPPSGPLAIRQRGKIKKPPKTALEEEEFTGVITTIIRRDFFPDTAKLEAQLEFLEASETNDHERLRQISERYATTTHTPASATPSTFETPSSTPSTREKLKRSKDSSSGTPSSELPPDAKKPKPEEIKSLDEFLYKYNSEDDASFDEILEKAEEERERKYAWLYHQEEEYQKPLALPSGEQQLAITDGSKTTSRNIQRSGVETWAYTAKNSLMYVPDEVEDSVKESLDKSIKKREIVYPNTRLSRSFLQKTSAAVVKATAGEGESVGGKKDKEKVGVDGKMMAESETPKVNGFGFVATPQIHPGVDASPLMTWGTIDGTPLRLETDILPTSAPAFKIMDVSKRDAVGLRLAESAAKATKESSFSGSQSRCAEEEARSHTHCHSSATDALPGCS